MLAILVVKIKAIMLKTRDKLPSELELCAGELALVTSTMDEENVGDCAAYKE